MARSTREVEVFRERERESPPRNRWDRDRFDFYRTQPQARERDIDIRISESRSPPGGHAPVAPPPPRGSDSRTIVEERDRTVERDHGRFREHDHDRFVERDRYGPPEGRRYWEEPTPSEVARGALAPYRKVVEYEQLPPSRPRYIRRQSSLDTFDRRPSRYEQDEWRPPSYVPHALPYRGGRGYDPYFDDPRYRGRDLSPGWEEEYRDVRVRRKSRRGKHRHRRERSVSVSSSSSSSSDDRKSATTVRTSRTEKEVSVLLGKKGKTRMPKRLVHKQAVIDLGLPYDEEEHFIIVRRALEKDHIDDVIKRSEGYKDTKVTYKFEEVRTGGFEQDRVSENIESRSVRASSPSTAIAPPPPPPMILEIPPPPGSIAPSHHSHHSHRSRSRANSVRDDFYESRKTEIIESEHADRRSSRSIKDEIRALEAEREALRLERRADRRLIEAERRDDREEVVFVEKDRRGRKAPDPKAVAFAMATLT